MRTERPFSTLVALASAALATLFLIACQQSQPPAPGPAPEPKPASTDVFVVFEGPWAIVPDPKDANSVLALAPRTKSHNALAVVPANTTLEAGVYDLSVPAHGAPAGPNLDGSFFRANVDAKSAQRALDNKLERYAIRLPKPEAYLAETRHRSRVGGTYPPDASTEQDYVTSISLRYSVTSKAGFSLAGTKDVGGAFNPLLFQLDTPVVRFEINPAEGHANDACNTHSRESFHELVHLLGLTLYVDFPESPADCHKKDPQQAHSEKTQLLHGLPFERIANLFGDDMAQPQAAGIADGSFGGYTGSLTERAVHALGAAIFFHSGAGSCTSPIIVGGP